MRPKRQRVNQASQRAADRRVLTSITLEVSLWEIANPLNIPFAVRRRCGTLFAQVYEDQ
jgi:hypothetical protein